MHFDKYESTGNDFLITSMKALEKSGVDISLNKISEIAKRICDRHFGIGADGLLLLDESKIDRQGFGSYAPDPKADVRFYGINSDGSLFEMSGNGFRCFALYASDNGFGLIDTPGAKRISAETLAGTKSVLLNKKDNETIGVVDMDEVSFDPKAIPFSGSDPMQVPIKLLGKERIGIAVNSGIPHLVVNVDSIAELNSSDLAEEALSARFDLSFPNNTNVSVVFIESPDHVIARVFERGAQETLSCGTGATAIAGALNKIGKTNTNLTVSLPGGDLSVYLGKTAQLSGPVNFIANCNFNL